MNHPAIGFGPLAESELDSSIDSRPLLPLGCDYQGRYPEAAHAATELCDDGLPPNMTDAEKALLCMICVASVSIVAAAALWVWWTFA